MYPGIDAWGKGCRRKGAGPPVPPWHLLFLGGVGMRHVELHSPRKSGGWGVGGILYLEFSWTVSFCFQVLGSGEEVDVFE